jgi:hypothetical protein
MSTKSEKKIGFPISKSHAEQGFGRFPYVIIRLQYAIYMQFPIHFVKDRKDSLAGISIKTDSSDPKEQQALLLDAIAQFKSQIDEQKKRSHQLCVVLGEDQAYYFDEEGIKFSHSIPKGGTLLNSQQDFIAMGFPHQIQTKQSEHHG